MDPASLALAVVAVVRDIYILGNYFYKKGVSVKYVWKEREELLRDFDRSFLVLLAFRAYLIEGDAKITVNPEIHAMWLQYIQPILANIATHMESYVRLAAEVDERYKSLALARADGQESILSQIKLLPPPDSLTPPSPPQPSTDGKLQRFRSLWKSDPDKKLVSTIKDPDAWRWAFIQKPKLETVLRSFKKEVDSLREWMPFMTYQNMPGSDRPSTGEVEESHAQNLGIARHLRIRQIVNAPKDDSFVTPLTGAELKVSASPRPISVGEYKAAGSTTFEKVLVEFKDVALQSDVPLSPRELAEVAEQRKTMLGRLATLLSEAGRGNLRTLPFVGYMRYEESRYAFLFRYPTNADTNREPLDLHQMIKTNSVSQRLTLDDRYLVAKKIAAGIGAFHNDDWLHKSIRSDSILFFFEKPESGKSNLPGRAGSPPRQRLMVESPYITNFECARPVVSLSYQAADSDFDRNIYRHPHRQGKPVVTYRQMYDISSLAVVLLELGVWQTASDIHYSRFGEKTKEQKRETLWYYLQQTAEIRLPHYMSGKYTSAVKTCFDDRVIGPMMDSKDKAARYYEGVVDKLSPS